MRKVSVIAGVIALLASTSAFALADAPDQSSLAQAQTATHGTADPSLTYVKKLAASTTKSGLTLAGDLQTTNTCMDAKFVASNGQYQAVEFRRPGTDGKACGQIVLYKHVVTSFPGVQQASNVIVEAKGYDVSVR